MDISNHQKNDKTSIGFSESNWLNFISLKMALEKLDNRETIEKVCPNIFDFFMIKL